MDAFSLTRRSLRRPQFRRQAGIVVVLVLLFASWTYWFVRGTVTIYVVSRRARIEARRPPVSVQAPVDGRVVFSDAQAGRHVKPGDVILKLDSSVLELRWTELTEAVRTSTASVDALRATLDADEARPSRSHDAAGDDDADIARAEMAIAKWKAEIESLDEEIRRRTVRAPVEGVLADVVDVTPGMTLSSRERIATIRPDGPLLGRAFFAAQESLGRVHPGQPATLRLDAFPWTQFGTVRATVRDVGQDMGDGSVLVELSIAESNPTLPLEHGLTGECEVEVQTTSPMRLLLRSIARRVVPEPVAPLQTEHHDAATSEAP